MKGTYKPVAMWLGIIAVGVIAMLFISGGFSPARLVKTPITEEAVVTHLLGDSCIVSTKDTALSAKTIQNCNVPVGKKVIVKYEQGSRDAVLVQP